MEIFFNELSLKPARSTQEAVEWIEKFIRLAKLIRGTLDCVNPNDDSFIIRNTEVFFDETIVNATTINDLLWSGQIDDDNVNLFYTIFDAPHVQLDDPIAADLIFNNIEITINKQNFQLDEVKGICAASIKNGLLLSFDSDALWDVCTFQASIAYFDNTTRLCTRVLIVPRHASKCSHIKNCHLDFFNSVYNFSTHNAFFEHGRENITFLKFLYQIILVSDNQINNLAQDLETVFLGVWQSFYHNLAVLSTENRIAKINQMVKEIATIQRWQRNRNLTRLNNRDIYELPNTLDILIGIDTQHGEFEVHSNTDGNNHLGAVSFDGQRFKGRINNRGIRIR